MQTPPDDADTVTPVFRWTGAYVGFLTNGWLFDAHGRYLGWQDDAARVWAADGTSLGQLVDRHYVLRNTLAVSPVRRTPRVPPLPPAVPHPASARTPRIPRPGWVDGLTAIGIVPTRAELVGSWWQAESRLLLSAEGRYHWSSPDRPDDAGTWVYRGNLITTPDASPSHPAANLVYRIVEYTGNTLTLRRLSTTDHCLMFTLYREEEQSSRGAGGGGD